MRVAYARMLHPVLTGDWVIQMLFFTAEVCKEHSLMWLSRFEF